MTGARRARSPAMRVDCEGKVGAKLVEWPRTRPNNGQHSSPSHSPWQCGGRGTPLDHQGPCTVKVWLLNGQRTGATPLPDASASFHLPRESTTTWILAFHPGDLRDVLVQVLPGSSSRGRATAAVQSVSSPKPPPSSDMRTNRLIYQGDCDEVRPPRRDFGTWSGVEPRLSLERDSER